MQLLSTIRAQQGRLEEAVSLLKLAIACEPRNPEAHNNLGLVLQGCGRIDAAIAAFKKAVELRKPYVIALTNLGVALDKAGERQAAIDAYNQALVAAPEHVPALNNLGAALHAEGKLEQALLHFEEAHTIDPDFVDTEKNLAAVLSDLGRLEASIEHYRNVLRSSPKDPSIHLNLGELLRDTGRYQDAINHFEVASQIDSSSAAARSGLATALQEIGRLDEARQEFRKAISLEPECLKHYLCLAHITKFTLDDPIVHAMRRFAKDMSSLSEEDRIDLHFALGQALSTIGEQREAFAHTLAANALKRPSIIYDEKRTLGLAHRIASIFSPELIERLRENEASDASPIFIVGMPRSGSTLVEQILASHPQVLAAGEVDTFREVLNGIGKKKGQWRYPESVPSMGAEHLDEIAVRYLQGMAAHVRDVQKRSYITNKMLANFRYVGLIHGIFPNARMIHTFRNPIDTCLSCFSIQFGRQPFSFDLGELGRHYRSYWLLMKHWKKILPPGAILEVRYEDVVQNFDENARRIIGYCNLPWDDACLKFYETERPVRTASVAQVRQPIYSSSIEKWRPDAATLRPLLEGLGLRTSAHENHKVAAMTSAQNA